MSCRRAKILMLVLVLFLASYTYKVNGVIPDLTQLVKNNGEIMCFAGGTEVNSALDWAYPITNKSEDLPRTGLYYIPRLNSEFNCNFEPDKIRTGVWALTNWTISQSFELITDARWEGLKMMHFWNNMHEAIDKKITIPDTFDLGISIRTNSGVTIWLCEGWIPDKYPCFLLKIGLPDKKTVSLERNDNATEPKYFKEASDIFSEHEWKNFKLSYNGEHHLKLTDVTKNEEWTYYTEKNNTALKPLFLFITSTTPSLWKIHNNHFLYLNVSTVTKFGPAIFAKSSVICVSLYVSMCKYCSMIFFILTNDTKQVVSNINGMNEQTENSKLLQWKNYKFTINDNEQDNVQLYLETISTADDMFWKIDEVRICSNNEIKVATLFVPRSLTIEEEAQISCHVLLSPEWTPNKQRLPPLNDLPEIEYELSPTTIKLSWTETTQVRYPRYYAIKYEGNDLCESVEKHYRSNKRLKSNGWIVTHLNTAVIENLIPYTFYSILLQDLVYPQNKTLSLNTVKTDKPVLEEMPRNIRIKPLEESAKLFFDSAECNVTYGTLVYRVVFYNRALNFSNEFIDVKNNYGVENLLPFTDYNLTVEVARNVSNLNKAALKFVQIYNFTTRPAVAPAVRNLEVYETDETSISIRFDLPQHPKGRPKYIRIQHCHPLYLNTCEFEINNISKCRVWEDKYCSEVNNMIRNHSFWLAVSLKNENTHSFGKEANLLATTMAEKPAPPVNLTYKVIHYNEKTAYYDLNISWSHPYNQKGLITAFDVFLFEEQEFVTKSIHEVLQIPNKSYQRDYVKSIKFVPYVAKYNISVRAINNKYKSEFASVELYTNHFRNYQDQIPTIVNHTSTTMFVKVPALDRRLGTYTLTIVVQNTGNKSTVDHELILLADDSLCLDNVESWIATVVEITEDRIPLIEIGDGAETNFTWLNQTVVNKPLQPNNEYCINFILKNVYKKMEHVVVYQEKYTNTVRDAYDENESNKSVIIMISLTILIVTVLVGLVLYRYGKGVIYQRRYRQDGEHIYEAMPFDDFSEPNVAYNATYDKLKH